jgi:hypothetical protein
VAGGYSHSGYFPSFVGFAPADRPRLVGVVAIAEPRGQYYGGQVAAPVFGSLARQILLYMSVRPERAPLALWPGEKPNESLGGIVTAKLAAPPRAQPAAFPDDEDPPPSLLLEGAQSPSGEPAGPESEHSAPGAGGRSHAPF